MLDGKIMKIEADHGSLVGPHKPQRRQVKRWSPGAGGGGEDNSRPSSSISGRSLATPTDAGKWGLQEKRKNTCWRWGHHPPFSLVHYVVVAAAAVYRCHLSRRTRACVQRAWPGFLRSTVACTTVHEYVCSIRICATTCRKKNEAQSPLCKGAWQPHFFLQLCMYICSKYPIYSYIYIAHHVCCKWIEHTWHMHLLLQNYGALKGVNTNPFTSNIMCSSGLHK